MRLLKKYLMCIPDGGNTISKFNTYIRESDPLWLAYAANLPTAICRLIIDATLRGVTMGWFCRK